MAQKVAQANLNVKDSKELLSYIINQNPILKENIPLPTQGESINGIGKIIMKNYAYKNAFLNTINLIGVTVITRNHWENPWKEFTEKGMISYGQQIREIIVDIANIYDYNEMLKHESDFIKTEVPNVLTHIHEINYQKFYKTTTSDMQMAMAFESGDLFTLIDQIVNSMYEADEYDTYLVNKYMLCRRILDGTVTPVEITDFAGKTDRDIVSDIKAESDDMTFRSPRYNPAGIRKATSFDDQFAIVSTKFNAKFTTNVLATSYFKSEAELKAHMALCDGFGNIDSERLAKVFAKRDDQGNIIPGVYVDGYVPFTPDELAKLKEIPAVIVGRDFFQNRDYAIDNQAPTKQTEFYNPQTLKRNHFLHKESAVSTSPFENAVVFTQTTPAVSGVKLSPAVATVVEGQELKLTAIVTATGFANKAVLFTIDSPAEQAGVTIRQDGTLTIPDGAEVETVTVTATSIFNKEVSGTATITVQKKM